MENGIVGMRPSLAVRRVVTDAAVLPEVPERTDRAVRIQIIEGDRSAAVTCDQKKFTALIDTKEKKAMKKIAEFCDIEIYMDEEFSGSPAVDVNYLDDDVQGSIDLEQGVIKGDFSKYVLPVIEAWLKEHREMLLGMWKEKKIGLIPAWE